MKFKVKDEKFILYEVIDMSNWCKKKTLLKLLENNGNKMTERRFRLLVAYNNILYNEHKRDKYIAHSNEHGYIATTNRNIILASIKDLEIRALDMLTNVSRTKKRLSEEGYDELL